MIFAIVVGIVVVIKFGLVHSDLDDIVEIAVLVGLSGGQWIVHPIAIDNIFILMNSDGHRKNGDKRIRGIRSREWRF